MLAQRDFTYLPRFFRFRLLYSRVGSVRKYKKLDRETLIHGLERNFNGMSHPAFIEIVNIFLAGQGFAKATNENFPNRTLDLIRESVHDKLDIELDDPNHAPFRHIMLFDKSSSDVVVSLLRHPALGLEGVSEVIRVGDFEEDRSETSLTNVILQIKEAMARGGTVVLVNGSHVRSSFYDVFNKHFQGMLSEEQDPEDPSKKRYTMSYYAYLGIRSHSESCLVNPNFKLVFVADRDEQAHLPIPFLNRFERYLVTPSRFFSDLLSRSNGWRSNSHPRDSPRGRRCRCGALWSLF
jgi:hypothetical protein